MEPKLKWTLAGALGLALVAVTASAEARDFGHGYGKDPDQICQSSKLRAVSVYYGCLVKAAADDGKQSRCDDRFARRFERADRISPGCGPLDNLARTQAGVRYQAQAALVGDIDPPPCAKMITGTDTVTCQLAAPGQLTAVYDVNLNDLLTQVQEANSSVSDTTVVWLQAWGGDGGAGHDYNNSGKGGFAQTITTLSDLQDQLGVVELFYFLGNHGTHTGLSGGQGGAATIVTTQDLSQTPTEAPDQSAILMIAGGGGGSGGDGEGLKGCLGEEPHFGGNGGVAIATTTATALGQGADASVGGKGGGQDVGGIGQDTSSDAEHGNGGVGGRGGEDGSGYHDQVSGNPGWVNTSTISPPLTFTAGQGGVGGSDNNICTSGGGAGGGGYGGGGGGSHGNEDTKAGAGGGGGSVAIASTQSDGDAPTSMPTNPNGATGFIQLVFNLSPKQ
jgi:hypothetical protein